MSVQYVHLPRLRVCVCVCMCVWERVSQLVISPHKLTPVAHSRCPSIIKPCHSYTSHTLFYPTNYQLLTPICSLSHWVVLVLVAGYNLALLKYLARLKFSIALLDSYRHSCGIRWQGREILTPGNWIRLSISSAFTGLSVCLHLESLGIHGYTDTERQPGTSIAPHRQTHRGSWLSGDDQIWMDISLDVNDHVSEGNKKMLG